MNLEDNCKTRMQWIIENIVMIIIKHLQMNQILASNNLLGVDMPLKKKKL